MADSDFPTTLTRSPGWKGWIVESPKEAVQIGRRASGLPVINKRFTFIGLNFRNTSNLVPQADYETIMTHYNTYNDVPFNWVNTQKPDTPITYEVIWAQPPRCQLDRLRDRWRISIVFTQYSPL